MMARWLYPIGLVCLCQLCAAEVAEVPVTGRWEDLAYSSSAVHRITLEKYTEALAGYSAKHQLDTDRKLTLRVRAISRSLIRAAIALKPAARDWAWEIHTTSDPNIDAYCMAGGKLMVGSDFVHRLKLNDGELAMLIAHEVAHVVAEHHREELAEVMRISGAHSTTPEIAMAQLYSDFTLQFRLADLSNRQESEADHLGMILAHNAGWRARDIMRFYRKLAATDSSAIMSGAYPSMASRLSMAKGMTQLFKKDESRWPKNLSR